MSTEDFVTPLTMDIGIDAGGEYEQHGEVSIVMTTEQADKLAELLDRIIDTVSLDGDIEGAQFVRILVDAIREARNTEGDNR